MLREHPKGLGVIFMTELWERFSYYGMRALLILYMTKQLLFADEKAYGIFGAYTALVYATPVIGGYIADKILGQRKAVLMGAFIMMLGHFAMAFESFFYPALALLVVGNGIFKPNMGPLLGNLYEKNDPRRDGGFTIFYMSVNIGGWLSPLLCGFIGETYGWHYGFGLAGIGMLSGMLIFNHGQGIFKENGLPPAESLQKKYFGLNKIAWVWIVAFITVPFFVILLSQNQAMSYLLGTLGLIVTIVVIVSALREQKEDRDKLLVAFILTIYSIFFWAFFFQGGSSLTLFAERNVDRNILGWVVKASMLESVNPMFIILLAPLFSSMWIKLSKISKEPSTPIKFIWGTFLLGIGFGLFALGKYFAVDGLVPFVFLILGYMVYTMGELAISPVGLSMITKLSPKKIVGFMMGVWFLSSAFANYVAALIAKLTSVDNGQQAVSVTDTLYGFTNVFESVLWICIIASALMLIFVKPLRKMMHGVH
jgi:proton-dependent oligopeptide transporter, POT family